MEVEGMYEIRMVGLMKHLEEVRDTHSLLKEVEEHEKQLIRPLGNEFIEWREQHQKSSDVKKGTRKEHEQRLKVKVTHGYLQESLVQDDTADMSKTNRWLNLKLSSHRRICVSNSRTRNRQQRYKKEERKRSTEKGRNGCPVCMWKTQGVGVPPCVLLSSSGADFIPWCKAQSDSKNPLPRSPRKLKTFLLATASYKGWRHRNMVGWTDTHPLENWKNRPDLVIWDAKWKLCKIVEVTVPLDTNLAKTYKDKETKYIELILILNNTEDISFQ